MGKKMLIIILSIALILVVIIKLVTIPKWEYLVRKVYASGYTSRSDEGAIYMTSCEPSEADLDSLGKAGWELVSATLEVQTAFPNFGDKDYVTGIQPNIRPQDLLLIFKRPK